MQPARIRGKATSKTRSQSWGRDVLGIRLLFGEDHAYAIVVTATTRKKVELKATPAELRSKAFEVRENLTARASDPRPLLAQLYAMVVAPVEDDLKTS